MRGRRQHIWTGIDAEWGRKVAVNAVAGMILDAGINAVAGSIIERAMYKQ